VLRQESEGEVTLEETECFGWSNRVCPESAEGVLPGDTFQEEKVASVSIMLLQDLTLSTNRQLWNLVRTENEVKQTPPFFSPSSSPQTKNPYCYTRLQLVIEIWVRVPPSFK